MAKRTAVMSWEDEVEQTKFRVDRVETKHKVKFQLIQVSDRNSWQPFVLLERSWSLSNLRKDASLFFGMEIPAE